MEALGDLQAWMALHADAYEANLFYILAALAIPCAYGVIFDRAVIRSGFLLIGVFGAISGLFLLLQAQFLAMAQIMIYAVGITLVVVIALMLTNPKSDRDPSPAIPQSRLAGFSVAILIFITIYSALRTGSFHQVAEKAAMPNLLLIGTALTTTYALPFEFASVMLLASMVGAIMLAKSDKGKEGD